MAGVGARRGRPARRKSDHASGPSRDEGLWERRVESAVASVRGLLDLVSALKMGLDNLAAMTQGSGQDAIRAADRVTEASVLVEKIYATGGGMGDLVGFVGNVASLVDLLVLNSAIDSGAMPVSGQDTEREIRHMTREVSHAASAIIARIHSLGQESCDAVKSLGAIELTLNTIASRHESITSVVAQQSMMVDQLAIRVESAQQAVLDLSGEGSDISASMADCIEWARAISERLRGHVD